MFLAFRVVYAVKELDSHDKHLASLIEKDHSNKKECEGYDDVSGK